MPRIHKTDSKVSRRQRPLLRRAIRLGASRPVVAEVLGASESEVQATLKEEGLPKFNSTGIVQYAKLHGRRVSDVEREIVRAYKSGVSVGALCGQYHTSGVALHKVLLGANVTLRTAGRPTTQRRVARAVFEEEHSNRSRTMGRQLCAACRRLQRNAARQ